MVSATKFVVAGAIVALFGGFLLSGVLTQPSDEKLPTAAAAASGSQEVVPSARPTKAPVQSLNSDLLPGVDLLTVEVAPGVFQVRSDGTHDLVDVDDVAVTPEGDVFVARNLVDPESTHLDWGPVYDNEVLRLGQPDPVLQARDANEWSLHLAEDGAPVVFAIANPLLLGFAENEIGPEEIEWLRTDVAPIEPIAGPESQASVFRDGRWTPHRFFEPQPETDGSCGAYEEPANRLVVGDECWTNRHEDGIWKLGYDWEDERGIVPATAFGASKDQTVSRLVAAADGTGWASVSGPGGWDDAEFAGLARYDGSTWSFIPYVAATDPGGAGGDGPAIRGGHPKILTVAPDGTPWVGFVSGGSNLTVASWDGDRWRNHGSVRTSSEGDDDQTRFRPDGSVLFLDGVAAFDGFELRSTGLASGTLVFDQRGNAWKVSGNGLYVMTPDAFAAATESSDAEYPATTTDALDLLPGVDLVTEEVEPGVVQVMSDGIRDLSAIGPPAVQSHSEKDGFAIAPDGAVWLHPGGDDTRTLIKLGDPGSFPALSEVWPEMRFGADGVLWGDDRKALHRLGDAGWSEVAGAGWLWDVDADGTLWSALGDANVGRLDASGWQEYPIDLDAFDDEFRQLLKDYGEPRELPRPRLDDLAVDANGDVWAALAVTDERFGAMVLLRHDGETWSLVDPLGLGGYRSVGLLDVGTDGTLWVYLETGDEAELPYLARLADDRWTVFSEEDGVVDLWDKDEAHGLLRVGHDGAVWMQPQGEAGYQGVRVFDGKTWRHYLDDRDVIEIEFAPDGRAWVVTFDQLYVITPEAVAATE